MTSTTLWTTTVSPLNPDDVLNIDLNFNSDFDFNSLNWEDVTWILTSCFLILTMKTETSVETSGSMYSIFVFELSLATISTTIITGAIAERASTAVWCIYAFLSTFVYAFPACWMWGSQGFLRQRGAVDVGGGLVVQTVGATQALVYCLLLGRRNREKSSVPRSIPDPNNALVGYFMLLWGFLGLTSGSAFGVRGTKWHLVAKAATTTILSAMVGFSWGLVLSHIVTRVRTGKGRYFVRDMMQGSLGAVVAITAVLVLAAGKLFSHIGLDDPCSVVAVHGVGGIWGTIAVGFFSRVTKKFVGLRVSEEVENDGLDKHTHGIVPNVENWEFKIANFPIVVRENSGSAPSTTSDNEPSETHQLSFWKDRQEWAGSTSVSSVAGLIQDHEDVIKLKQSIIPMIAGQDGYMYVLSSCDLYQVNLQNEILSRDLFVSDGLGVLFSITKASVPVLQMVQIFRIWHLLPRITRLYWKYQFLLFLRQSDNNLNNKSSSNIKSFNIPSSNIILSFQSSA
ncbi:unnamed protein product [Cyprideis torosa]|uniref:Ammonium transporter AmtB-like domain-containing protein n=1 Tax=Cyprideis torosa TaxID=163714 RepID=A0A7R8WI70_9CRUS|nr:unnamed protein product [Cyprideis torosa]CAG0898420.1 unnamed protein product [Cyprideis torosa]